MDRIFNHRLTFFRCILGISLLLMSMGGHVFSDEIPSHIKDVYLGLDNAVLDQLNTLPQTNETLTLKAVLLEKKGLYNDAVYTLKQVKPSSDFQPIITYMLFKIQLHLGRERAALDYLRELKNRVDNQFFIRKAEIELAKYYTQNDQDTQASGIIEKLQRMGLDPIVEPVILSIKIQTALAKNDQHQVTRLYGQLIKKYPAYDHNGAIWDDIKSRFLNRIQLSDCFEFPQEYLSYLNALYESKLYELVIRQANKMLQQYPTYQRTGEVYLILAKTYMHRKQFSFALEALRKASVLDPNKLATISYLRALTLWYSNQYDEAVPFFERSISEAANPDIQTASTYYLAAYFHQFGPQKRFLDAKSQLSKMKPDDYAEKLEWLIKMGQIKQDTQSDYFTKVSTFSSLFKSKKMGGDVYRYIEQFPRTSIRSLPQTKQFNYVINAFPLSFFSIQSLDAIKTLTQNTSSKRSTSSSSVLANQEQFLYNTGQANLALELLTYKQFITPTTSQLGPKLWLHYNTYQFDEMDTDSSDTLDFFVKQPLTDPKLYPVVYPQLHADWVRYYADKYHIPAEWLWAIMKETSNFNPYFQNQDRVGIMGFKSDTARQISYQIGFYWKNNITIYDVERNIHIAAYYLNYLNQTFKGNMVKVITGFYEGDRAVLTWMPKSDLETTNFILNIPSAYIQTSVQNTLDTILIYRFLYPDAKD